MRVVSIALIVFVLCFDGMGLNLRPRTNDQQLTDANSQAVRQLALEFTTRFLQTKDLAPIIKDLYAKDSIDRYLKAKSTVLGRPSDLDFVPGLFYNSRLYAEASTEDLLRFYTAANNFMFFGIVSALQKSRNTSNLKPTDVYPANVTDLLNTNPSLSDMIVKKGSTKALSSVEEMRNATATLEQAVVLMRAHTEGQSPLKLNEQELMKAMQDDNYFKPVVRTIDAQFFGFAQGTQLIFINTPILFRLIIVKTDNKLEILWAEPTRGS
ncbi:MAG TPA: hypothetical protein VFR80_01185 [Pyrinomonadaceae bacterium]|nr:hypothetical protein [Pyrinomonadaceae bacterium]